MTDEHSVRTPPALPDGVGPATIGVRGGVLRSQFQETAEAMYLASGYVYESAVAAERAFTGETDRYLYSRYGNPTITMFEERLRLIEGAPAAIAAASGMAVFATPLLQQGFPLGVDVVVYSGSKHVDGQGQVLGGAILGGKEYIDGPVQKLMRHTGPAISAFNAWILLKGLEMLAVRVDYANSSAQRVAEFLEGHPAVSWVRYPYLASHPQCDLAKRQMSGGGTVITFELDARGSAAKKRAFDVLDNLRLIDISNNLGDAKSLVTHPATTTHRAMGPEGRATIGLGDGVIRISVGLENTEDLIADLDQGCAEA